MVRIKVYNKELLKITGNFIYSKHFLFGHFNAFEINVVMKPTSGNRKMPEK